MQVTSRFRPGWAIAVMAVATVSWAPPVARCQPAAATKPAAASPAAAKPAPAAPATGEDDGDLARKMEIMNSPRWRRAIFELGEWLSSQQIYTPPEVHNIKADFNKRVARMSSYELDYLLDDLDAKFKILDTAEAKDARQWVGQYLSVMSDQKRAEALKDVPDVVRMSSSQLQQEIDKIEQKRNSLQQQQTAFDASRQQLVERGRERVVLGAQHRPVEADRGKGVGEAGGECHVGRRGGSPVAAGLADRCPAAVGSHVERRPVEDEVEGGVPRPHDVAARGPCHRAHDEVGGKADHLPRLVDERPVLRVQGADGLRRAVNANLFEDLQAGRAEVGQPRHTTLR